MEPKTEKEKNKTHYIVGIGASAGGLEAIIAFFENVPEDSGLSFVLIQHLSPDYKSMMPDLLAKHTNMDVIEVTNNLTVKPNCIYPIPTNKNITIQNGKLQLKDRPDPKLLNLPINIFFKSLAEDQGEKAVGVILSGSGSDGTIGIESIKQHDGLVIVQDPKTAAFENMPVSAMGSGLVDIVSHPAQMPNAILQYIKHPYIQKKESSQGVGDELSQILDLLHLRVNVDFHHYKKGTITRRIERRMGILNITQIEQYLNFMKTNKEEVELLYKDLLIGVSGFFRDDAAFMMLDKDVIGGIVKEKLQNGIPEKEVRIWVIGCSTGQEVYSIAMLLKEHYEANDIEIPTKIFGTDIDQDAIDFASKGVYAESSVLEIPPRLLEKYFVQDDDYYQVSKVLREMIIFAKHDITRDPPFNNIDLASCRNLLIYIEPKLQEKILSYIQFSLNEKGYLFLGSSETPGSKPFEVISKKHKIYRNKQFGQSMEVHKLFSLTKKLNFKKPFDTNQPINSQIRETGIIGIFKDALLEDLVYPSVIIDQNSNVVHVAGEIDKYIKLPKKQLSLNILKMIDEQLYVAVSSITSKSKSTHKKIVSTPISFSDNTIRIHSKGITDPHTLEKYTVLSFVDVTGEKQVKVTAENSQETEAFVRQLEDELNETKDYLQSAVEELETSNEELQATNEELMAANEELQSSNEELQSLNEELYTVNNEYQEKLGELTDLNDDLYNFIQGTNIATLFLDLEMRIKRFTNAIKPLFDINNTDIGRPIDVFNHPFKNFDLKKVVNKVIDKQKTYEEEVITAKGYYYLVRIIPYMTSRRKVEGVVLVIVDVNDLKQTENQLKQNASELEQSNADLEQFAYLAAHDIKAPMTNISELVKLLKKGNGVNDGATKIFERLESSVAQMHHTIVDLNKVISIKKNLNLDPEKIRLKEVCNGVLESIGEIIKSSGAEIATDFKKAPEIYFPAVHLENIIQNLITNAIKYKSPERSPVIRISSKKEDGFTQLIFEDNGRGIDLDTYGPKFFQLFQRFHLDVEGSGIGLHVVRTMMNKYGGKIDVDSEVDKGTTFTLYFLNTKKGEPANVEND